ncbi:MAG: putative glycolipid-binding domain-containing protein [Pseudomonadota bacterium]
MSSSIIWRKFEGAGHEIAFVEWLDNGWRLYGTAVFSNQDLPCRMDYAVICDASWETKQVKVNGLVGIKKVDINLEVDDEKQWFLNGSILPELSGCIDIDLGFSPSTNLLPIRRLELGIGQESEVNAAWLHFPSLELKVLPQTYRRDAEKDYRYESNGGSFVSMLKVNDVGFVTDYPGLWQAESEKNTP